MLFRGIFDQIAAEAAALDVMIALGTHQPMSEEAICYRLEISMQERKTNTAQSAFLIRTLGIKPVTCPGCFTSPIRSGPSALCSRAHR
jgi:hypothetical protein